MRDKDAPLIAAGTLLANVKIQFLDEQGQEVPAGQPGEIVVSTPTIMMLVIPPPIPTLLVARYLMILQGLQRKSGRDSREYAWVRLV